MLSQADREVAARDRELPGLALLLDAAALAGLLGIAPPAEPYLRYKPGTSAALSFRTDAREGLGAFAALAYPPGRYAEVRARPSWRDGAERAVFLDDACVAVVPATLDRKLRARALRRLADPDRRAALLGAKLGAAGAEAGASLLRYNPKRRLVLRLDGAAGPLAVARAYAPEDWSRALEGARLAAALGGAPLLAADPGERLLLVGWTAGHPLCGALDPAALGATGAALARVHAAPPRPEHVLGPAEQDRERAAAVEAVTAIAPTLEILVTEAADAVRQALAATTPLPRLIHGDFSADQVILGNEGPAIIDWDRAATGDPARDLGSFLARLDVQAIDGVLTDAEAEAAAAAFLAGYRAITPLPPGLAGQHARALVLLVPEGFRRRLPTWPERAHAILGRVRNLVSRRTSAAEDSGLPMLRLVLDPVAMAPRLAEAAGIPPEAIVDAKLLRRKPGRRALVRYGLREGPALLGKLRAKGPDAHTPVLHAALRAAGLDGAAPRRVGVPRARGSLPGLHLWLQEEAPGRPIADHLRPGCGAAAAERAGAALARLHACPVATSRIWRLEDEIDVLDRALGHAAARLPAAAGRIAGIARSARDCAARLGPGPSAGIHRDWHPDQALVDGDTVWIVDLDLYTRGDPAIDLGNFAAHLTELGVREHGDALALAAHQRAFYAGYACADGAIDAGRVAVMHAISLARHVGISQSVCGRSHATPALIEAAIDAFDRLVLAKQRI